MCERAWDSTAYTLGLPVGTNANFLGQYLLQSFPQDAFKLQEKEQ